MAEKSNEDGVFWVKYTSSKHLDSEEDFMMKLNKVFKTYVAAVLTSALLIGGTATAENTTPTEISFNNVVVTKSASAQVDKWAQKAKANSDAKITLSTKISVNDEVSAFVINKDGAIVSKESAKFRGTSANTTKSAPYRSDAGIKGQNYKLVISLSQSSQSSQVTVAGKFAP